MTANTAGNHPIRTLIVEDDRLSARLLERLIASESDFENVAVCVDGRAAIEAVNTLEPDLVFLDIGLPDIDGVAVAEKIVARPGHPFVIFVTAHDEHALFAFELDAVDYVMKPVARARFRIALERARRTLGARWEDTEEDAEPELAFIARRNGEVHRITAREIAWVEAASQYSMLYTDQGNFVRAEPLGALEKRLEGDSRFYRVHRSAIVNAARIEKIVRDRDNSHRLVLDTGSRVPVARRRRGLIEKLLREACTRN